MEGTRGPVISPEHRSPGFHDLPVAADTALTLRLRCRIAVANRFPVYFPSNDPQLTRRLRCGRPRRTLRIYHICAVLITMLLGLFSRVHISRIVIAQLFIRASTAVHCSPAYLFTTSSALVPSDSAASWKDYSLLHHNNRFTFYALPLTMFLCIAFGSGFRCRRSSRFIPHFYTMTYLMASSWATYSITTHLSRYTTFNRRLNYGLLGLEP